MHFFSKQSKHIKQHGKSTDKQPTVKEAQIEAIQSEDAKEEADEEGLENQDGN